MGGAGSMVASELGVGYMGAKVTGMLVSGGHTVPLQKRS